MANKYTQMFFTMLSTVHLPYAHYSHTHTNEKKLYFLNIYWKYFEMYKQTNEQQQKKRAYTHTHTHPSKNTQYTKMRTFCIQTNTAELLTRIIVITLNWYYRWQNIEKSCWDRFWLILSSFTIITHIDAIFPRYFDNFEQKFTHFIAS